VCEDVEKNGSWDEPSDGLDVGGLNLADPSADGCARTIQTSARMPLRVPGQKDVIFGQWSRQPTRYGDYKERS